MIRTTKKHQSSNLIKVINPPTFKIILFEQYSEWENFETNTFYYIDHFKNDLRTHFFALKIPRRVEVCLKMSRKINILPFSLEELC